MCHNRCLKIPFIFKKRIYVIISLCLQNIKNAQSLIGCNEGFLCLYIIDHFRSFHPLTSLYKSILDLECSPWVSMSNTTFSIHSTSTPSRYFCLHFSGSFLSSIFLHLYGKWCASALHSRLLFFLLYTPFSGYFNNSLS